MQYIKTDVLSCKFNAKNGTLTIKTKIERQQFPYGEGVLASVPTEGDATDITVSFHSMYTKGGGRFEKKSF